MIWEKSKSALAAGEHLTAQFWQPGSDQVANGVIRWSQADGVSIELVGQGPDWPDLGADEQFVIHAATDSNDALTILDGWVRTTSAFGEVRRLAGATLALGEHVTAERRWPRAIYSTAGLSEWVADSGLTWPRSPTGIAMKWEPPARIEFRLPGAQVALAGRADPSPMGYMAHWSIATSHTLVVNPTRPQSMDRLHDVYAGPLLALMVFAADRPDSLTREMLVDPDRSEQVEIWRRGRRIEPREWQPDSGYLFQAHDLRNLPTAFRRWWRLHKDVWPALDLFGAHVQDGSTYSPARFLTLYTALEVYGRERHGQNNLRRLRDYAGVPDQVHGCGKRASALIGQTRKYLSHLRHDGEFTDAEISDSVFYSTRRASALMQACLLREMGFGPRRTARILSHYYRNWAIPLLDSDASPS